MGIFGKKDSGIFETLKHEHREVSALFEQIEANRANGQRAEQVFAILAGKLLAHAKGEEQVVYPRFAKLPGLSDLVLEARQEHEIVESLIVKLQTVELDPASWRATVKVLKEEVEHHVKEEENDVFPRARRELDDDAAEELARRYLAAKAELSEQSLMTELEGLSAAELKARAEAVGFAPDADLTRDELLAALITNR
jgi:hemerythrin superfamily protein